MKSSTFLFFAETIFRQQKEALEFLKKGDINGATKSLNHMEKVLEETLDGFKIERKSKDELAEEVAKIVLANDLPRTVRITMGEATEFLKSMTETIKKYI